MCVRERERQISDIVTCSLNEACVLFLCWRCFGALQCLSRCCVRAISPAIKFWPGVPFYRRARIVTAVDMGP